MTLTGPVITLVAPTSAQRPQRHAVHVRVSQTGWRSVSMAPGSFAILALVSGATASLPVRARQRCCRGASRCVSTLMGAVVSNSRRYLAGSGLARTFGVVRVLASACSSDGLGGSSHALQESLAELDGAWWFACAAGDEIQPFLQRAALGDGCPRTEPRAGCMCSAVACEHLVIACGS